MWNTIICTCPKTTVLPDCRQFYHNNCMEYKYEYFADILVSSVAGGD